MDECRYYLDGCTGWRFNNLTIRVSQLDLKIRTLHLISIFICKAHNTAFFISSIAIHFIAIVMNSVISIYRFPIEFSLYLSPEHNRAAVN